MIKTIIWPYLTTSSVIIYKIFLVNNNTFQDIHMDKWMFNQQS